MIHWWVYELFKQIEVLAQHPLNHDQVKERLLMLVNAVSDTDSMSPSAHLAKSVTEAMAYLAI